MTGSADKSFWWNRCLGAAGNSWSSCAVFRMLGGSARPSHLLNWMWWWTPHLRAWRDYHVAMVAREV